MSETDKLWALVHGQLNDPQAAELREALKADPALQRHYRQIQDMDRLLRETGSQAEVPEELLVKKVLHAWETSPEAGRWGAAAPDASAPTRVLRFPGEALLWLRQPWRALQTAATLAACALVLLGARNYFSPSLAWQPDRLEAAQYRGDKPADTGPVVEALRAMAADLRAEIASHYERQAGRTASRSVLRKRTEWRLATRIQELPESMLSVQVDAFRPGDPAPEIRWTRQFENAEAFSRDLPEFGGQVASDLLRAARPAQP
ncbi:MAG TPA: hypothetical protein P5567_00450 [Kiritimatiellia bacterium]|nr:hypothetical protein [Kiritimatiellia bacterium]HRZ10904.1 hypothetical protein [Kiritimatiellia bacterium]HSA18823.1 hypothetical protein [Kiritimatiellia bacterium]